MKIDSSSEDPRRQDDKIISRLFIALTISLFAQAGTIASGIWWAGKFEGTTITRLDVLEKASLTNNQLATNVAILNANVANLSENVSRLRNKLDALQSEGKRK